MNIRAARLATNVLAGICAATLDATPRYPAGG